MAMRKVIYDTDPGVDDAMALAFLVASPGVELVGITTVLGNADIETTTRNALYLKDFFGLSAPVVRGAGAPLVKPLAKPPTHVHGENGLGDIELSHPVTSKPLDMPAHRFIIEEVRRHPGEISIIAVGRMTNLALALREAPDIVPLVAEIVIMGGAFGYFGHSGNVTPVAEANIIGDPDAADEMFGAAWPITVVGLDVTQEAVMPTAYIEKLRDEAGRTGKFIWDISRFYENFYRSTTGLEGIPVHDSSAIAYWLDPTLFTTRGGPIRVVTEGIAIGQTIQMPDTREFPATGAWSGRPAHKICIDGDSDRFLKLYFDTIVAGAAKLAG